MRRYVTALLQAPRTWAAATAALRLKGKLEGSKKRRQHQSLMQLQVGDCSLIARWPRF